VKIERRAMRGIGIRAADIDGRPGVTLHAIKPGVVDDYGTLWEPDTFDESLAQRLPTLCWAHDWSEPLGPAVDYRTGADGPEIDFVFSDPDAVPIARRAHAQVSDGTIRDCSVGFWGAERRDPTDAERKQYPGIREVIYRANLDEVSLVLRGAVPGAKVLAVRGVPIDAVIDLARRKADGEISLEEAKAALELLNEEAAVQQEQAPDDDGDEGGDGIDMEALAAELDAVAERSRRIA
jgi:HK97 family phage prohead protease